MGLELPAGAPCSDPLARRCVLPLDFHPAHPAQTTRTILSLCAPTLRVFIFGLILPMNGSTGLAKELRAIDEGELDPRVVLAAYSGSLEYCLEGRHNALEVSGGEIYNDWGHPSTTLATLWERAEQVIKVVELLSRGASGFDRTWSETECPLEVFYLQFPCIQKDTTTCRDMYI